MTALAHSLSARMVRARSHYLSELVDILRCGRLEDNKYQREYLQSLAEEGAEVACGLAVNAHVVWNAAQEQLYAADKDDPPLREYVRGVLAAALALVEDVLKAAPAGAGPFVKLHKEADRLRLELLGTSRPWKEG